MTVIEVQPKNRRREGYLKPELVWIVFEDKQEVLEVRAREEAEAYAIARARRIAEQERDAATARAEAAEQENERLQGQVRTLKMQVTEARRNNEQRNRELDALHYVWCSGGCEGGVNRYSEDAMTQEIVDAAVANTERLQQWWKNHLYRQARAAALAATTEREP